MEEKRKLRLCVTEAVFLLLTITLVYMNITIGSVKAASADIIWKIRLPRMAASGILGGAPALSGFLLQTFFNNPIAGPYVLGISHGAKLAVALVMIVLPGQRIAVCSAVMVGAGEFFRFILGRRAGNGYRLC